MKEIARSAPDLILPNLDRIIKSYVEGNSCGTDSHLLANLKGLEKELLGVLKRTSANYSLSKYERIHSTNIYVVDRSLKSCYEILLQMI